MMGWRKKKEPKIFNGYNCFICGVKFTREDKVEYRTISSAWGHADHFEDKITGITAIVDRGKDAIKQAKTKGKK